MLVGVALLGKPEEYKIDHLWKIVKKKKKKKKQELDYQSEIFSIREWE